MINVLKENLTDMPCYYRGEACLSQCTVVYFIL